MFFYPNKPIEIFDIPRLLESLSDLSHWVVQPKWNGKRIEIDCNGKIRLFSREGREWFLPEWDWLSDLPLKAPWFVDGELLRDKRIYVWDYALLDDKRAYKTRYGSRLDYLHDTINGMGNVPWSRDGYTLRCVDSLPATEYQTYMEQSDDPMLEGIVWKNLKATNMWGPHKTGKVSSQFKYLFPK